ncbi:MAG: hypothetical protein KC618_06770 [Candidatus Omnitrophica bacterium]|nr:hypothetical protein [Candidatus Omnitrophota bacterium]
MKKSIIMLMAAISLIAISSQAFAARYDKRAGKGYKIVTGTIVSINKTKHLFAIKDDDDGKVYGFMAWASDLASLNEGAHVTVTTEHPGAIALSIR